MVSRKQRILCLFLLLLPRTLSGCAASPTVSDATPSAQVTRNVSPTHVRLRITKTSATPLDQLIVLFPNEQIDFGPVAAGATTEYQPVQGGVYRYAAYRITFDNQTVTQGVSDGLGEKPLVGNVFTYVLSVDLQQSLAPIQSEVQRE
jgi:hypothetical protein